MYIVQKYKYYKIMRKKSHQCSLTAGLSTLLILQKQLFSSLSTVSSKSSSIYIYIYK